jgi:hypothetical protein
LITIACQTAVDMAINACEGLPDGPCPLQCRDESVVYSIYDLFLCQSCLKTRERSEHAGKSPKEQEGATNKTANTNISTKARNKNQNNKQRQLEVRERDGNVTGTQQPANNNKAATADKKSNAITNATMTEAAAKNDSDSEDDTEQCACCLGTLRQNATRIRCQVCSGCFHFTCTGVPEQARRPFMETVKHVGWVCDDCKIAAHSAFNELQTRIAELAETVAALQEEVRNIRASTVGIFEAQPAQSTASTGSMASEQRTPETDGQRPGPSEFDVAVQYILQETDRRKRNVIVAGLTERPGTSDEKLFSDLCETYLQCKPLITNCLRIGKNSDSRQRKLLVRLRNDEVAYQLLKDAKRLRHASDSSISRNVYITVYRVLFYIQLLSFMTNKMIIIKK